MEQKTEEPKYQAPIHRDFLIPWNFYELKNHYHRDYSAIRNPQSRDASSKEDTETDLRKQLDASR